MALEHRTRPQWGVQFHPESIATEHGKRLLANFRDLTPRPTGGVSLFAPYRATKATLGSSTKVAIRRIDALPDP